MDTILSVITINYNGLEDTCAMLDSIPIVDDIEVIVVDNGSREDEASIIEQRYPQATIVRSKANLGFAGGNNLGIQTSHGKYIFFVNNDTLLEERGKRKDKRGLSLFQSLIDRLESAKEIGVVCPKIRFAWDNNPIQYAGYTPLSSITLRNQPIGLGEDDYGQYDTPHPTPYAHGAAMMMKRETIEKAGLMPECYFLYYEELDWSVRIRQAGFTIWYDPSFTIFHKESKTTGQDSPLRTYYMMRNRLLFAKRNLKWPKRPLSYCYLTGVVAMRDMIKHLLNRRKDLFGATVQAIADFIKGRSGYKNFNK